MGISCLGALVAQIWRVNSQLAYNIR